MTAPKPYIPEGGPILEFDLPGLAVGVAEYEEGPTGCTVFDFGPGAIFAADIRGGSPGTFQADLGWARAICFAGGSLMGLEACNGVAAELFARRGHEHADWNDVPTVAGAIVFDFGARRNGVYPDRELGRAALRAARPGVFPLGRRGAGRNTSVGKVMGFDRSESGGQGGAFGGAGETKVAVFTVVNALGAIVDREGRVARGNLDRATGERSRPAPGFAATPQAGGNTTLTLVATNQRLGGRALTQLARQVHASMARAIQPFHTTNDGDTLFAVSVGQVEGGPLADLSHLGVVASELAWDAVLCCWEPDS